MRVLKFSIPAVLATMLAFSGTTVFAKGNNNSNTNYQHRYIPVQLLGLNDFHGQVDVTRNVNGQVVGGAAYLASYLEKYEQMNKNTLLVDAGDMVGASAPTSSLLQDEPTISFLNKIGMDVGTLGNHEFDHGTTEMMRLINGGDNPVTGNYFAGANFPYVCANVVDKKTGKPLLPPYVIKKVNGMPIGFIGVVTTTTPSIVIPSAVKDVKFLDETTAINKATKELEAKGVHAIVVLAHVPGTSNEDGSHPTGDIVTIAKHVNNDVDVIFAGHNHDYMNTTVDGKLIVQAYSYGTAFSDVNLEIDPKTKDIIKKSATIIQTYHNGMTPDPAIQQMISKDQREAGKQTNVVVGKTNEAITATQNAAGESALGDLIADSQRVSMDADIAVMNPGGIRADLEPGDITWGDLKTVQPFGNVIVKENMTGKQIIDLLNQQWHASSGPTMLQISGFNYTWDPAKPLGEKVVSVTINGQELDPNATYTVAANNFLAAGGDGFTELTQGSNSITGPTDMDAIVQYLKTMPQPISVSTDGRIQVR